MYTSPVLPAPAIGGISLVAAPGPSGPGGSGAVDTARDSLGAVLPNTGAPIGPLLAVVLVTAAVAMVGLGVLLVRRSSANGSRPRPVLRAAGWLGLAGLLVGAVVSSLLVGDIPTGWDLVGLLVAILTLGYALLALRTILPAPRPAVTA